MDDKNEEAPGAATLEAQSKTHSIDAEFVPENTNEGNGNDGLRLKWAIKLAAHGFKIIPLTPRTKDPISGSSWLTMMSSDPDVIQNWTQEYPDCNFGIVAFNHHVIIDLDQKGDKKGIDNFEALECEQDFDQIVSGQTLTVATPSGGKHIYLSVEQAVGNASAFGAKSGIDVRGKHGYVVGSYCYTDLDLSSNTFEGTYTIQHEDAEIIPAPPWIIDKLKSERARDEQAQKPMFDLDHPDAIVRARKFLEKRAPAIQGQNGNDHTYATVVMVKDLGLSAEKCLEVLTEPFGWNSRCKPEWDAQELEVLTANAYKFGKERPGTKGGALLERFDTVMAAKGLPMDDMVDISTIDFDALESGFDDGEDSDEDSDLAVSNEWGIGDRRILSISEAEAQFGDSKFFIQDWMRDQGVHAILAEQYVGKTTMMIGQALALATDRDWMRQPTERGLYVLYLCGEDQAGTVAMVRAAMKAMGIAKEPERFRIIGALPRVPDMADCKKFIQYVRREFPKDARVVVYLDTWQRATSSASQNDDQEMQQALENLEYVARKLNAPAVAAFHPPKHDRQTVSGSQQIQNAAFAVLRLAKKECGHRELTIGKLKGASDDSKIIMKFRKLELSGTDQFGRVRTGIVAEFVGGVDAVSMDAEIAEAWANVIAGLMMDAEQDDDFVKNRQRYFTLRDTAHRLQGLTWSTDAATAQAFPSVKTLQNGALARYFEKPVSIAMVGPKDEPLELALVRDATTGRARFTIQERVKDKLLLAGE